MLAKTDYFVLKEYIPEALDSLPKVNFRLSLNEPTGKFFYDPWTLKSEYKFSVWRSILDSILEPIGEARIIILQPGKAYQSHADIDDRYHLNLAGTQSYLIDLEKDELHKLVPDTYWYDLDAGKLHSAVNFGRTERIQLVVRKLLKNAILKEPVAVTIEAIDMTADHARFVFDNTFSPVLNKYNKLGLMNSFEHTATQVKFNVEYEQLEHLKTIASNSFRIIT